MYMYYAQALLWVNLKNRKLCAGTQKPPMDGRYRKKSLSGAIFFAQGQRLIRFFLHMSKKSSKFARKFAVKRVKPLTV